MSSTEKIKSPKLKYEYDLQLFSKYCERIVQLVEKVGIYSIFIPEILPPNMIKTVK